MLTRPILLTETADTALPGRTPEQLAFAADLAQAFTLRPRAISPKYFYDAQGS